MKLSKKIANLIYDILVQECGVLEGKDNYNRECFVSHQTTEEVIEWRFCGKLGFGGKFWRNGGKMYVNCYREDETPERLKMIEAANKRLEDL